MKNSHQNSNPANSTSQITNIPDDCDMMQMECSCNNISFILINNYDNSYITTCQNCGKKIYFVNCKKCETGFSFTEGDEHFHLHEGWWHCENCDERNDIKLTKFITVKNYLENEIPKEVTDRYRSFKDTWWWNIVMAIFVLLAIFLIYYNR